MEISPATDRVANVYQISRSTVRIRPKPGYDVAVMVGVEMQAFIVAADGSETVILKMAPSKSSVSVVRHVDGHVDVIYPEEKA